MLMGRQGRGWLSFQSVILVHRYKVTCQCISESSIILGNLFLGHLKATIKILFLLFIFLATLFPQEM